MNLLTLIPLLLALAGGAATWWQSQRVDDLQAQFDLCRAETATVIAQREHLIETTNAQNEEVRHLAQRNQALTVRAQQASEQAEQQLQQWQQMVAQGSGHEDLNQWLNTLLQ